MAKQKTTETDVDVYTFIDSYVEKEQKRADSLALIELLQKWSGFAPKMWGPTIIGFGRYHYKYASGHEGNAPILGFSPRKAQFSLYVYSQTPECEALLENLGKFKMGKACIYVKKLSDIDLSVLEALCKETIAFLNAHHDCAKPEK